MIIQCPHCQSKYKYPEDRFEGAAIKKVKCSKCKDAFEIKNPSMSDSTGNIASKTRRIEGEKTESMTPEDAALRGYAMLPSDRKFSISVLDGPDAGKIFQIEQHTVTVGRTGADLALNDPESSRLHAHIQIQGRKYILKDLGSTNGTFVEEKRLDGEIEIHNLTEFRIGSTELMFIETEEKT